MKNKTKKTKKFNPDDAFGIGWEASDLTVNAICSQIPEKYDDERDEAFIAAFRAFSLLMSRVYKKEFLLEIVSEMWEDASKDHECDDCAKEASTISDEARSKMH